MKIIVSKNYELLSKEAAKLFLEQLKRKKSSLFGLATGSSPVGMYKEIAKAGADFTYSKSCNLDEYVSLPASHPQSYAHFMQENFFKKVNFRPENTFIPSGVAKDIGAECRRYDEILSRLGRIDLQILGLGVDGHIGFNEPSDVFPVETHEVVLDKSTIEANARFFENADEVPRRAVTMGLAPIMGAKSVLLLVSGKNKAKILKETLFGPVTPRVPASILQLHPNTTLLCDEEAFSLCHEN